MEPWPDYVPRWWSRRRRLNRWVAAEPRRVFACFVGVPAGGALATVAELLAGSQFWWLLAAMTVLVVLQAVVYAPRAYRAMRERDRDGASDERV
jgi:membrane protein implicated in regulation of membrane protease activity